MVAGRGGLLCVMVDYGGGRLCPISKGRREGGRGAGPIIFLCLPLNIFCYCVFTGVWWSGWGCLDNFRESAPVSEVSRGQTRVVRLMHTLLLAEPSHQSQINNF